MRSTQQFFAARGTEKLPTATLTTLSLQASAAELSTTTPIRVIDALTIPDVIPASGKFIAADLVRMELSLYDDGKLVQMYPIASKGRPGSPYETPAGVYRVLMKERVHTNRKEGVLMPYSMEFYGNYFIHGWPIYANGDPVASTYSGGCIRLSTPDAEKVFAFADIHTPLFVYDPGAKKELHTLVLNTHDLPLVSAHGYLVADLDTGDVYAERDANVIRPIASVTKLMTALVANETIMFDRRVAIDGGILEHKPSQHAGTNVAFTVGDLFYPLLMESNNYVADTLASYHSTGAFIDWMNAHAKALDMASTTFADASGKSSKNVSTPDDLYRLAVYLTNKKSFIWKITRTPEKTIVADDGTKFTFSNYNLYADQPSFVGGKVGHTEAAQDTMVSVFTVPVAESTRRIAIVVLGSMDYKIDTSSLLAWFKSATKVGAGAACVTCIPKIPEYRKIEL